MIPLLVPKGPIYHDQEDKKRLESRNGVLQAQFVFSQVDEWSNSHRFTPDLLKEIQRLGINQIFRCAGHLRDASVTIVEDSGGRPGAVRHVPPEAAQVPGLVDEMCDYVNSQWDTSTPSHLASYLMWRINWIHPFFGGNGRTARAASYLVFCARIGFKLPGAKTVPELIVENRGPYNQALRHADAAWAEGKLDISKMEEMMHGLIAKQLVGIYSLATGQAPEATT